MRPLWLVLLLFSLAACQPFPPRPTDPTPTVVQCHQAGEVRAEQFDSPTRGYAYHYEIYLPPCYAATETAYPVLYLIPGRGSGPATWFAAGANLVADRLILAGKLPPFVIVATENTDFDPHGEVIFQDLLPYVESRYHLQADRQHRAVAGGSLGGIAAYRLGLQHPKSFSSFGLFGSGVVVGEEPAVQGWLAALPAATPTRAFLACGAQDHLMLGPAQTTVALLAAAQIPHVYQTLPGGHDYPTWVSALEPYFLWLAHTW